MLMVIGAAVLCRGFRPDQRELSRKIVHIGTGAVLPLAWAFTIPAMVAIPFAIVVTLLTWMNHQWRLIPAVEDVDRNSYGTIAYGLAITILLLLFWPDHADAACAGVLVMALGDGCAGLVGRAVRSPRWVVLGQTKSLAGTLTMFLVSTAVLIGLSTWSESIAAFTMALAIATTATALEQISVAGVDNLSVPLVVGLLWATLLN